jgi:hypothetical protein
MTTETKVEQPTREYGFTLMVKADGNIHLTPHDLNNDFEFAGLVAYVNQKKDDLMKTIGLSIETRTLQSVGLLAKVLANQASEALKSKED